MTGKDYDSETGKNKYKIVQPSERNALVKATEALSQKTSIIFRVEVHGGMDTEFEHNKEVFIDDVSGSEVKGHLADGMEVQCIFSDEGNWMYV
jgi:hypothetical protein